MNSPKSTKCTLPYVYRLLYNKINSVPKVRTRREKRISKINKFELNLKWNYKCLFTARTHRENQMNIYIYGLSALSAISLTVNPIINVSTLIPLFPSRPHTLSISANTARFHSIIILCAVSLLFYCISGADHSEFDASLSAALPHRLPATQTESHCRPWSVQWRWRQLYDDNASDAERREQPGQPLPAVYLSGDVVHSGDRLPESTGEWKWLLNKEEEIK